MRMCASRKGKQTTCNKCNIQYLIPKLRIPIDRKHFDQLCYSKGQGVELGSTCTKKHFQEAIRAGFAPRASRFDIQHLNPLTTLTIQGMQCTVSNPQLTVPFSLFSFMTHTAKFAPEGKFHSLARKTFLVYVTSWKQEVFLVLRELRTQGWWRWVRWPGHRTGFAHALKVLEFQNKNSRP